MAPSSSSKAYFASSSVKPFGRMTWKSAPTGKIVPLMPVAQNLAAEDRDDPPDAMAEIAGDDRRADPDGEAEDVFGLKR